MVQKGRQVVGDRDVSHSSLVHTGIVVFQDRYDRNGGQWDIVAVDRVPHHGVGPVFSLCRKTAVLDHKCLAAKLLRKLEISGALSVDIAVHGSKWDIFTVIGHFGDRVAGVEIQYVLSATGNLNVIFRFCGECSRCGIQIKAVPDRADPVGIIDFPYIVRSNVFIGAMVDKGLKIPQKDSGCDEHDGGYQNRQFLNVSQYRKNKPSLISADT